nr:ATP-binding protein [Ramlibacter agri]
MIAGPLLAAAVVISFVAWTLTATLKETERAAGWVRHSEEVLGTLGRFRESFSAIDAAQRGFLLDGRATFLQQRDLAITDAGQAVLQLRQLTSDNPQQQQRSLDLGLLLAERADATRAVAREMQPPLALQLPPEQLARLRSTADNMRNLSRELEDEERRLLQARQAVEVQRQRRTTLVLAASFVVFALMVLLAYLFAMREAKRRRRTERQMTDLVENLPTTVWQMVTDLDGRRRFIYVGKGSYTSRGLHAEELLADQAAALESVADEDRQRVAEALYVSEQTLQPLDVIYRVRPPHDGAAERWVHKHARLRRRGDGTLLWTGHWTDITEQKQMERALREATEEARRASRAKGSFLATMSHEIRTPMTGVLGLLELLGLSRLDGEQRSTVAMIRESSTALLRIIDDILDFSKGEEGRLTLDPVPASLRDVVRRACEVHSGMALAQGLQLEYSVDPRVAPMHVFDPVRVGQILNNFLSNAVKFTETGGVHVQVELLERHVSIERLRLTVIDTGIGVPPDTIPQLFQPFEQGAPRIASTYGGSGLGLAISRNLAEQMGGTVQMRSTPGRGTQMTLELDLPLADPAAMGAEAVADAAQRRLHATLIARRAAPPAEVAEAEGTLVLVVDDHPTNRVVLSRQVATLGYGVLVAEDGVQGLALWQSRRIGLVLTDSAMPHMNGYELARAIRRLEEAAGRPRTPILACTANVLHDEPARVAAAGMDGCLFKPVALPELLQQLEHWLPLPDGAGHVAPADQARAADGPFDGALLELISGGDRQLEGRILEEFLQANEEDLAQLQAATDAYDTREVARLAHRVMGAAQTLGATELRHACRGLEENAIVAEPQANLAADLERVKTHAAALLERLRARMAGA